MFPVWAKKVPWSLSKFSFIFIAQHCSQKLFSKKWVHEHNIALKAQQAMTKSYCKRQLGAREGGYKTPAGLGRAVIGVQGRDRRWGFWHKMPPKPLNLSIKDRVGFWHKHLPKPPLPLQNPIPKPLHLFKSH